MTAERPTTERLREALEQALDRMETAWGLLNPDIWSDAARVQGGPAEGVSQALYFGIEEADRALAAAPVDRDGPREALEELGDRIAYAVHQAINDVPPMRVVNTDYVPQAKRRPDAVVDRHAVIVAAKAAVLAAIKENQP